MGKLSSLLSVVLLGLCAVKGFPETGLVKRQYGFSPREMEQDEKKANLPSSPRFLVRRATTVMYDDFSSGGLDPRRWYHTISLTALHHQFHMLTPAHANSYVRNGILYIKPTLTVDWFGEHFLQNGKLNGTALWGRCSWGPCYQEGPEIHPIMSAMVRTHAHIKYGKVEIIAKLAKGDWLWNALWLMPTNPPHYGQWPRSGEMDILEATGNRHMTTPNGQHSAGNDAAHCTFHYGPSQEQDAKTGEIYRLNHGMFGDAYHRYWLDWNENHVTMGVDDHPCISIPTPSTSIWHEGHFTGNNVWAHGGKNAPWDQPFFLIMNVAVGGGNFADNNINHPYPKPYKFSELESGTAMHKFWNARHLWEPTWIGEDKALKIRSVKMEQY